MATIKINGRKICSINGSNICITNNKIVVDGEEVTLPEQKHIKIEIIGDVNHLENSSGEVLVKGNVDTISTISADVRVEQSVTGNIKTVSGDVSIRGNQSGEIKTISGDINK